MNIMTLKELSIGDKFINVKKPKEKWVVRGNPAFNFKHGSPTRVCARLSDNLLISKSCKIEVEKIGESVHKEKMIQTPINFR